MASNTKKAVAKKPGVRLEDLMFYFDGVERDRLDASGTSRKTGEVLALRDRLLKMPEQQFEATIKTVKSMLIDEQEIEDQAEGRARRTGQARQLFDQARPGRSGSGGVNRASKVSAT